MPRLICAGKTLLTSKGGTSLVKGEDTIPGGEVGAERSIIANGVFGSGGGGGRASGFVQNVGGIFHNTVVGRQFIRCSERG
jgi:hypothetical protein